MAQPGQAPPRVYVFHGGHHHHRRNLIQRLMERVGQQGDAHLDVVVLDGTAISLQDLAQQVLTFPFLAPRRLVVVRKPLALAGNAVARKAFLRLLEQVPQHTALVLDIEEDLEPNHWLLQWTREHPERAFVRATPVPRDLGSMLRWMDQVVREAGGRIHQEALATLYGLVGQDVDRAYQELVKLALYSQALERSLTSQDLADLVLESPPPNLFELGHALAEGRGNQAMAVLHQLLQREDPRTLWHLVIRHFRLLLVARELLEEGGDLTAWARQERLPRFVVRRLTHQARRFSLEALERLYLRLVDLEDRIRRFELTHAEALEQVVYGLMGVG